MFSEIGGSFWINPEEEGLIAEQDFNFISKEECVVYTSSGRGAITFLLKELKQQKKVVLLPLYTCESVIDPFLKEGYEIFYFDINADLSADAEKLTAIVNKTKPSLILLHAYFGFDTIKNIRSRFAYFKSCGVTIIEDITHSLFSEFPKDGADYFIASLRKWAALPDGGMALSKESKMKMPESRIHEQLVNTMLEAFYLKSEYVKDPDSKKKERFRELFYKADQILDADSGVYAMSDVSRRLFRQGDYKTLRERRRNNFQCLLDNLQKDIPVKKVFSELPADVVPLYFPVYAPGNRDKLQKYLAENEIYAPVHWPYPFEKGGRAAVGARPAVYDSILSIPCDQRYSETDMEKICQYINNFCASHE